MPCGDVGPVEQLPFGGREIIIPLVYSWVFRVPQIPRNISHSLCIPLNVVPLTIIDLQILTAEFSGPSDVDRGY